MRTPDHAAAPIIAVTGWAVGGAITLASGIWAATSSLDTGLITGGAAGLLALLFRSWFKENKRKDEGVWEIADEYRVERDFERARADHWQARWLALVQQTPDTDIPPMPNLEDMKAGAQREKEASRGRRGK